ncbi:MAG: hypothetical protein ACE5FU_11890, partial [Nitrospinota bacterium]
MPKPTLLQLTSFDTYNKNKIKRALSISPKKTAFALYVIPYLLHTNQEGLPGFIENKEMPQGIFDYKIEEHAVEALKVYFPDLLFSNHKG